MIAGAAICMLGLLAATQAQPMKLGEALVLSMPDLKADADVEAFEAFVLGRLAPAWKQSAPGMELHLVRKDRGNHKGRYLLAYITDTLAHRQGYASKPSEDSPFSAELLAKLGDVLSGLDRFVNSSGPYIEYHLVGAKAIASLPAVEILGIHYTKVRPDRRQALDQFLTSKLHPAVGNLRPDLGLLYYKPVRGTAAENYLAIFALTVASRDKYWPGGSDSEELKAAFGPVRPFADELRTYLVEGSYATGDLAAAVYESREWADWVRVRNK
jgi:hypothetical protein